MERMELHCFRLLILKVSLLWFLPDFVQELNLFYFKILQLKDYVKMVFLIVGV
jgi:hypothetical protein